MTKKKAVVKKQKEEEIVQEATPAIIEQPMVPSDYKTKMNKSQVELIKNQIAVGATNDELKMFLYVCERTKLDPFTKQIYFVQRWDSRSGQNKGAVQVGIDGLRSVAERTGLYAGNDDAIFEGEENGKPQRATAKVYKMVSGVRCEFTATARWAEYYPGDKQGFMWKNKPHIMLGKCAEALALRKAFPQVMSGLYITEEMGQATPAETESEKNAKGFEMLKGALKTMTAKKIEEFMKRLEDSDKYSLEQKKEYNELAKARLEELNKK